MTLTKSDLLLHPVRLRIVLAISGEELTTADLAERLPDVPQATLYRQVATLADGGLLEVVEERRLRGGVERTYRLVAGEAGIGAEEAAAMSTDDHMRGFVTFVAALVDSFGRYLQDPDSSPAEDAVGYRQAALWLTKKEAESLAKDLAAALDPYLAQGPSADRDRILLNSILIPDFSAS